MITMKITSKDIILDTDERIRMQSEPVQLPLSNEDRELFTGHVRLCAQFTR